ncbi:MAG: glycosyltransferase family 9 protein [Alcanivorax sp.]|uniref:glycosyltransferase family 9 protein n=1 Tax=Alcanivorax sp. TaxID=1872427 RepID=UPI003DA7291D
MSRLLILFPCSHMGNLLIALPHLRAMLAAQPQALLVVSQRYQSLVEQSLPGETRLLYYPELSLSRQVPLFQRVRSYLTLIMAMRRFKAEVVVDIEGEQKSATLARLSGAVERIGPHRRHGQWFYTRQPQADWSGHRWQAYASLSRPAANSPARYLPLSDTAAGQDEANRILKGTRQSDNLIAIHAGATKTYKIWHAEQFAALCRRLRRAGLTPLLIGAGQKDRQQIARIQSFLCDPVIDLCDQLSLAGLVALLQRSRGFIGNDSGPMHLAAACGLPTVALFGPTDDTLWQPLSPDAQVLRWQPCHESCERSSCALDSYPCLQGITVDQVIDTLQQLGVIPAYHPGPVKPLRIS